MSRDVTKGNSPLRLSGFPAYFTRGSTMALLGAAAALAGKRGSTPFRVELGLGETLPGTWQPSSIPPPLLDGSRTDP